MRIRYCLLPMLLAACTSAPPPHPTQSPNAAATPAIYGMTMAEEGKILALEDRREFDGALAEQWITHPNALHRARMALALGRIGPHTFVDTNANGERDPGEVQAGVALLGRLAGDADPTVRLTTAFALGEIGDVAGLEPLLRLGNDGDGRVASEAIEALAKLAPRIPLEPYLQFIAPSEPLGVRATGVRFLFRFASDQASAVAADLLDTPEVRLREAAAYALARRAYPQARGRLELLLTDPDYTVRSYAAAALGRIGAKESVGPLINALLDEHPWTRTNALVALSRIATKNPDALARPELAQDAQRIIASTEDPDPGTRASAIDILGYYARQIDAARRKLADLQTSGSRWERELAVGATAKQFNGSKATTSWEKVRSIEGHFDAHYAADPDPMVRAAVLGNLPEGQVDANIDLVRKGLDDADVVVRANAIDQFAKSKAVDVQTLRAAERRGRSDVMDDARLSAIAALGAIDHPDRESYLRGLLTDADPVVRRVAADLIEEKLKKNRPQYTPLPIDRPASFYEQIASWSHDRHTARLRTARGDIKIALLTQDAPMTTWNFVVLARRHYFDKMTFMRVVPNFVIQTGDPRNDMSGGPGYAIRDEINMQKYTRGAVGMALSGPDTGGSQFFITHSSQPHLDGGYTVFGRLLQGMTAVVDQIERGDLVETVSIDAP